LSTVTLSAPLAQQGALVAAGGHRDQPVDPPRHQGQQQLPLPVGILVAAAGQHQGAVLPGDVLDDAVQPGGEGVGDVLQQQPDGGGLLVGAAQAAGGQVVAVAEQADGVEHAPGQLRGDPRLLVDDAGDGLETDTGQRGHIAHGRRSLATTVGLN
jgi:hypothetical protein